MKIVDTTEQRYLTVDSLFAIKHKIPNGTTAKQREPYLPENYEHYCLYLMEKNKRITQTKNITFEQQQIWLKKESFTSRHMNRIKKLSEQYKISYK